MLAVNGWWKIVIWSKFIQVAQTTEYASSNTLAHDSWSHESIISRDNVTDKSFTYFDITIHQKSIVIIRPRDNIQHQTQLNYKPWSNIFVCQNHLFIKYAFSSAQLSTAMTQFLVHPFCTVKSVHIIKWYPNFRWVRNFHDQKSFTNHQRIC